MKRLLFIILSFSCLGVAQAGKVTVKAHPYAKSLAEMIGQVRGSVVRVLVCFPNTSGCNDGTGFFVNADGMVATALHLITPPPSAAGQDPSRIIIRVRIPTIRSARATVTSSWMDSDAIVAAKDSVHDILIIKPTGRNPFSATHVVVIGDKDLSPKHVVSIFDQHLFQDGEPIFTSGYPLELPILITTSGSIASSDPVEQERTTNATRDAYWADMHVNPGNSGGPVFSLLSGCTIGMVVQYDGAPVKFPDGSQGQGVVKLPDGTIGVQALVSNSGIAIILPAEYIVKLLGDSGIRYSVSEGKNH